MKSTTIIAVLGPNGLAMAGDGQVTLGSTIVKNCARKVRKIYDGKILVGFAGAVADSFALVDRFEAMLNKYSGNMQRAAVELTKEWRTDKYLRRLEAMLITGSKDKLLLISGNGEVIEPDDKILSIGSGSNFALSAAKALQEHTEMTEKEICEASMRIAAQMCVYTNDQFVCEELRNDE